jgi:2-deoxy-scyllo-inosamine dehydrogenase (SAM-dependent)
MAYSLFNPPLQAVEIEINSFCNRKCLNCPNHDHERPIAFLEDGLYYRIIDELAALHFSGRLTYNMFNEPLLDKRLPAFIAYARKMLPSVFIYLNTNGDLLDLNMWQNLRRAGLDFANVSQYDGRYNQNVQNLLDAVDDEEKKHIFHRVFDIEKDATNLGGSVPGVTRRSLPVKEFCVRPFYQLCVNYRGRVVLCCSDYFGAVEIGDLHRQSIKQLWRNWKFVYYRYKLMRKNRAGLRLCRDCDNMDVAVPQFPLKNRENPDV